jgi:hypothetical protein
MVDNVAITAGSGTTVATDEIDGIHYQKVKIAYGASDTANLAAVGAGNVDTGTPRFTLAADDPVKAILGATGDAAAANDTIKAALRAIATALGTTAFDLGVSTGGSRTLRVAIDTSQVAPAGTQYETVAASQTAQVLGATGAAGDYISGILVIPTTTSPGNVLLLDNATSITVFDGGASSVSNLVPFFIPLGMLSVSGAWKITTGTNVKCIGVGTFTA